MKKLISTALVCVLLLGLILPGSANAASFSQVGGWLESIYAILPGLSDSDITNVSYSGPVSGKLSGEDFTYLVRSTDGGVRIDIPGLRAGTYSLTVTTTSGTVTQEGIEVLAHDRSGFAHWNYTEGVGAYNDDGTLKEGAIVLYVTEENKNTVSVTSSDGTTVSGIGNILNSGGQDTTGTGTTAKGGKANTNQSILKKLALDGTPLVVRIVGTVSAPEGLTAWGSIDYGGNEDDNGAMARMQACRDITVEGIGNDAVINGWGFAVICQTGNHAAGLGRNFEFRNLTFTNVPEDCIGLEGTGTGTPADPIERCWVHNCAFYGPTNVKDASDDQDKGEGDGACDFKRGNYFTMSYCYYDTYHKTNLIGGSDSNQQYHVTWHHNWYKNCHSRAPLGRQADMHIYNNVFENQASYCMSLRANVYIFSEYNVYNNCKKISDNKGGGVCKALGNEYNNCTGQTNSDIITVTDRDQTVSSKNKFANFDTNAGLSYIPSGSYLLQTDTDAVEQTVKSTAGTMDCTYTKPGAAAPEIPGSGDPSQPTEPEGGVGSGVETPSVIPVGSYIHNFTENGKESSFFTIDGNLSTSKGTVDFDGQHLTQCLKIESSTSISFTAPEDGLLVMVFGTEVDNAAGKKIRLNGQDQIVGSDCTLTLNIGAGSHTITKNKTMHLFYLVYIPGSLSHTHSFGDWVTVSEPNELANGIRERKCGCGEKETQEISNNPFTDVGDGNKFKPAILWAYYHEITAGTTATTFAPEADVSRAQFVMFLWKAAGCPAPASQENPFEDVGSGSRFYTAILWAYHAGITAGKTSSSFAPNDPCTRTQVVAFLYRYAECPDVDAVENPFNDVGNGNRFLNAILWAYSNGITAGKTNTAFDPSSNCTRAQVVTFLYRYMNK